MILTQETKRRILEILKGFDQLKVIKMEKEQPPKQCKHVRSFNELTTVEQIEQIDPSRLMEHGFKTLRNLENERDLTLFLGYVAKTDKNVKRYNYLAHLYDEITEELTEARLNLIDLQKYTKAI